jgi:CheY-like chemotaxis protein
MPTCTPSRPFVLLVDDSDDDVFFFSRALRGASFSGEWMRVADGAAAIAFLQAACSGQHPKGRPDLIFLDLKMPHLSGFEVLEWVGRQSFEPPLDIAVLSGSEDGADVARATALGARAYFVKPILVQQLKSRLESWRSSPDRPLATAEIQSVSGPGGPP